MAKKLLVLSLAFGSLMAIGMAGSALATDVGGTGGPGTGHEHPAGGSPFRAPTVPAFRPCSTTSSNASHDPTLPGRSCSPPVPASAVAAVGPNSLGFARIIVLQTGQCAPPAFGTHCYPDVTIRVNITDVHAGSPTGALFNGSMTGTATIPGSAALNAIQVTDAKNKRDVSSGNCLSTTTNCSATVVPLPFPVPVTCTSGTCDAATTANALAPGSVTAGARGVVEIGRLELRDSAQAIFEDQGIMIP